MQPHLVSIDLRADHIVLDGFPALRERGTAPPQCFRPMSIVVTVAHLSYSSAVVIFSLSETQLNYHPFVCIATEVTGKNYAAFGAVMVISNLTLSDWTIDCCKKQELIRK